MEIFTTKSVKGTIALGKKFAKNLEQGDCVALEGELGSGKTVLVRGIAAGAGLEDERLVSSPSFVLVREYMGRLPLYHIDLYRLEAAENELEDLGIEEMLADGVVLIEWASRAGDVLPHPRWEVQIDITGPRIRKFAIQRVD